MRKNLEPLEAELKKKKSENSKLKSLVRYFRNKVKGRNLKIASFFK